MRNGSFSSGGEALTALRRAHAANDPFQIVILNQATADINGVALAREIQGDPTLRELLLVMVGWEEIEEAALEEAGISAFVEKPVRPSQLMDVLATVWKARRPAGAVAPDFEPKPKTIRSLKRRRLSLETPLLSFSPARILLAEDNPVNQIVAREMLTSVGCRVDVASDGKEVLEMLEIFPYDAVFMDCQMPEMDGYEATRAIRQKEGEDRIPIIAMTANAMLGDRERCFEAGMDDYIAKPAKLEEVVNKLQRWLEGRVQVQAAPSESERASQGPLDLSRLESLAALQKMSGSDLIGELAAQFFSDTLRRLSAIREALEGENAEELERVAHSLKGSSGNLGAWRMQELCEELEQRGRKGETGLAGDLLAELEKEYARVKNALESEPWKDM